MNKYFHSSVLEAAKDLHKHVPKGTICYISGIVPDSYHAISTTALLWKNRKWQQIHHYFNVIPRVDFIAPSVDIEPFIPLQVRDYAYYNSRVAKVIEVSAAAKKSTFGIQTIRHLDNCYVYNQPQYSIPFHDLNFYTFQGLLESDQIKIIEAELRDDNPR